VRHSFKLFDGPNEGFPELAGHQEPEDGRDHAGHANKPCDHPGLTLGAGFCVMSPLLEDVRNLVGRPGHAIDGLLGFAVSTANGLLIRAQQRRDNLVGEDLGDLMAVGCDTVEPCAINRRDEGRNASMAA
jgi:hypothetical protein